MSKQIDAAVAKKVLDTVDAGLVAGIGVQTPGKMCVEAAVCYALGLPHGDDPGCVSAAVRRLKIQLNDAIWSSPQARANGLRRLAIAQLGSKDNVDGFGFVKRVSTLMIKKYVPIALRSAAKIHKDTEHKDALEAAAKRCEKESSREAARSANAAANAAVNAANAANNAAYADAAAYAANYAANYAAAYAANAAADAAVNVAIYAANAYVAANVAADADAAVASVARDKVLADFAEDVVQILVEMKAPGCQWLYLTEP